MKEGQIAFAPHFNSPALMLSSPIALFYIVAFQVFGRCFSFFTLQDQLVALRVEEMQYADWLICLVWIQDGGITTNLLREKLRV